MRVLIDPSTPADWNVRYKDHVREEEPKEGSLSLECTFASMYRYNKGTSREQRGQMSYIPSKSWD